MLRKHLLKTFSLFVSLLTQACRVKQLLH